MASSKGIPDGTRVRHIHSAYEGWIDGRTDCPEPGSYRIRLHNRNRRETALPDMLEECQDVEKVFRSTETLHEKVISKPSNDDVNSKREYLTYWNNIVSLPYTIWSLNEYDPSDMGDPVKLVNDAAYNEYLIPLAIESFIPRLKEVLVPGIPIAVVPSHEAGKHNSALLEMVRVLAGLGHVDATSCLTRYETVESSRYLRQDGKRGNPIDIHTQSIRVTDSVPLSGRILLLLDNVVVTGATFLACRKVLLDGGVAEVICLALGKVRQEKSQKPSSRKIAILDLSKYRKEELP